jgi:hypothetical protein
MAKSAGVEGFYIRLSQRSLGKVYIKERVSYSMRKLHLSLTVVLLVIASSGPLYLHGIASKRTQRVSEPTAYTFTEVTFFPPIVVFGDDSGLYSPYLLNSPNQTLYQRFVVHSTEITGVNFIVFVTPRDMDSSVTLALYINGTLISKWTYYLGEIEAGGGPNSVGLLSLPSPPTPPIIHVRLNGTVVVAIHGIGPVLVGVYRGGTGAYLAQGE